MRAIVIFTSDRPVDVISLPDDISVLRLQQQTLRLDAAGVDYELLPISLNATAAELAADIERYARDDEDESADDETSDDLRAPTSDLAEIAPATRFTPVPGP